MYCWLGRMDVGKGVFYPTSFQARLLSKRPCAAIVTAIVQNELMEPFVGWLTSLNGIN